jgi:small-conductance mechanosensitive channel
MAKISKRVSARLSNAQHVLSSAQTHQDKVAASAAQTVTGLQANEIKQIISLFCAHLAFASQQLNDQEQAYVDEQADDPAALDKRDQALKALQKLLTEVQDLVQRYAPERLRALGLDSAPPLAQDAFARYANNVAKQLSKDTSPIDGPLGMRLSLPDAGAQLAQRAQAFEEALSGVSRERRELEATLITRDQALARWQVVYTAVSDILSGIYSIAGESKLAAKIRPTSRRVRGEVIAHDGGDQPADG